MRKGHKLPWSLILFTTCVAALLLDVPGSAAPKVFPELSDGSTWAWNPPGQVETPILLYHHISDRNTSSRYFVSPADFRAQVESLRRWGFTPIPLSLLVSALVEGAALPARPVVITFDDGYRDVYQYAFPILQEYGFVATVYVITDQIGVGGYLTKDQLTELVRAGWELGSHTRTHTSLRQPGVQLEDEILDSRLVLEASFAAPVTTFSYPYGLTSAWIRKQVEESGYTAAVGLGGSSQHTEKTRYYLSRIEIRNGFGLQKFGELLSLESEAASQTDRQELPESIPRRDIQWQ